MTLWLDRALEELSGQGWSVVSLPFLGLHTAVRQTFSPALADDPRGAGKTHARDVITYDWSPVCGGPRTFPLLQECESAAHGTVDDYSRFRLLECGAGVVAARAVLSMIPADLRQTSGRMSADYFHYERGAGSEAHQDKFGDFVAIWVLDREGEGGESFLYGLDGSEVLYRALQPGEMLVFRDAMFYHGVEAMRGGHRDAMIFITLRD